jgi:hypothetical protein
MYESIYALPSQDESNTLTHTNLMNERINSILERMKPGNMIYDLNVAMHRSPEITSFESMPTPWHDTDYAELPAFIKTVMLLQFRSKDYRKSKDIFIKAMAADDALRQEALAMLNTCVSSYLNTLNIILSESSATAGDIGRAIARASLKEVAKMQVLNVAPLYGHNLTEGGHFLHPDIPASFSAYFDEDSASMWREFGALLASMYGTKRKHDFTVPVASSQGLVLKSKRDTPQWRVYSKAIQAELASRCKNRANYDEMVEFMDSPFTSRGYDGVTHCVYLGIRRQGGRKDEWVSSKWAIDNSGDRGTATTNAWQGRARGIFPPSEFLKVYFKPFSEGIKSTLFKDCFSTLVENNFISVKLHLITELCVKHNLINDDGEYLCFYDLDAMDKTTHRGFADLYHAFCQGVFPDFKEIEGDTLNDALLFFPGNVDGDTFYKQQIAGRSTVSGQPDVTVKNNVCHYAAMSFGISKVTGDEPLDVFRMLITGEGKLKNGFPAIAHIHGDDTMMFFSDNHKDYEAYFNVLSNLGFGTSCELAPIFLKKTVCVDSFDIGGMKDASDAQSILISMFVDREMKDALKRHTTSYLSTLRGDNLASAYSVEYLGSMRPVPGSLFKNRFGEYEVTDHALLAMALSDTAGLLGERCHDAIKGLWHLIWYVGGLSGAYPDAPDDSPESLFSWLQDPSTVITIRDGVLLLAKGSATKATAIRSALERIYYSGGEQFDDVMIETIFGSLFITAEELTEAFDLASLTTEELKQLYLSLQNHLLDMEGDVPAMDEKFISAANDVLKRF